MRPAVNRIKTPNSSSLRNKYLYLERLYVRKLSSFGRRYIQGRRFLLSAITGFITSNPGDLPNGTGNMERQMKRCLKLGRFQACTALKTSLIVMRQQSFGSRLQQEAFQPDSFLAGRERKHLSLLFFAVMQMALRSWLLGLLELQRIHVLLKLLASTSRI